MSAAYKAEDTPLRRDGWAPTRAPSRCGCGPFAGLPGRRVVMKEDAEASDAVADAHA